LRSFVSAFGESVSTYLRRNERKYIYIYMYIYIYIYVCMHIYRYIDIDIYADR